MTEETVIEVDRSGNPRSAFLTGMLRKAYHCFVGAEDRELLWHLRHSGVLGGPASIRHHLEWRLRSPEQAVSRVFARQDLHGVRWCFILGVNNSGTTLLARVLQSHPEIRGLPTEGQFLTRALPRPPEFGVNRLWTQELGRFRWSELSKPTAALRCMYDWAPYYGRQSGRWLLEKSPPNTIRSRWLQAHFPSARFIAMVRSPYAVAEGIRRRTGASIEAAARHWAEANRLLLEDAEHLGEVHWIKYEGFCEFPARSLAQIREFLGLESHFSRDSVTDLEVHNIEDRVGGIQNFNDRSLRRLSVADMRAIEEESGPVMEALGYDRLTKGGSR